MRKKEVRAYYRQKRSQITIAEKDKWDDLLLIRFQQLNLPFLSRVLSFYPAEEKGEVNSFLLTRYLQFTNPGLEIAFPRMALGGTMDAVLPLHEDAFVPNEYSIMEPVGGHVVAPDTFDLVLVPLLAFDENGDRVGYGKGYYDRFLQHCRPDCLKVGLSYFEAIPLLEDANEFDIPLDLCITPHKAYVF